METNSPPGLADHLAVRDVFTQVGFDLAPDDLLEPVGITVDFSHHGCLALSAGSGASSYDRPESRRRLPGSAAFRLRSRRSTEPKNKRSLGNTPGNERSRWVEDVSECARPGRRCQRPGSPTANCIPRPEAGQGQCTIDSIIERFFGRTGSTRPSIRSRLTLRPARPAIPGCPRQSSRYLSRT